VTAFVARFSVFPTEHCAPTLALWYTHTHTHASEQFYVTPRLILDSAEPGSGKTRVLEVAQYLVRAPEMTISATPAALFRLVSMGPITILFDEVDAIFNPKNGGNHDDLRGLLNAGYKQSATIARCVGDTKTMKVERFPVYAPAALAGIAGHMPTTITTRAITIHMRRRRHDEPVEPFWERQVAQEARPLREQLTTWITTVATRLGDTHPTMPEGVTDRPAEIWEPLLAIADTAGNHWPTTTRNACRHFVLDTEPHNTSPGIRLLADLRDIYTRAGTDRMRTTDILPALHNLDESDWADHDGKPLDARRLARLLDRFGVKPGPVRVNGEHTKGYQTAGEHGLADAWSRYLPQPPPTRLLTVEAAATHLSIGRTTMYALLKSGHITSIRIGRLRRVPAEALAAYTTRLTTEQTTN
jgi:excisionase family DNA binding protein